MSNRIVCRLIWMSSFVGLVAIVYALPPKPRSTTAADKYKTFTLDDKTLRVSHPENWKTHTLLSQGKVETIYFEPALNTRFELHTDELAALMSQLMRGSGGTAPDLSALQPPGGLPNQPPARPKSPLESSHADNGAMMKFGYTDYNDGAPRPLKVAGCDALVSDFTFGKRQMFGSALEIVGKRYSFIAFGRDYQVICYCPKDQSEKLMPAFSRMVASIQVGKGVQ